MTFIPQSTSQTEDLYTSEVRYTFSLTVPSNNSRLLKDRSNPGFNVVSFKETRISLSRSVPSYPSLDIVRHASHDSDTLPLAEPCNVMAFPIDHHIPPSICLNHLAPPSIKKLRCYPNLACQSLYRSKDQ